MVGITFDPLEVGQALLLLCNDRLPEEDAYTTNCNVDLLLFHSRARGDSDGLFRLAADLYKDGTVGKIVINGSHGERSAGGARHEAWDGCEAWRERLVEDFDVNSDDIILSTPAYNTKQENDAFLDVCKAQRALTAALLTQPHQMLRTMLGMLQSMLTRDQWIATYAMMPSDTDFDKEVYGSQGQKCLPRFDHIAEEWRRIPEYQAKGDLASMKDLVAYLRSPGRQRLY